MLRKLPDRRLILAVDGGASKSDIALLEPDGSLVVASRRAGSYHLGLGQNGALEALDKAIRAAGVKAGLDPDGRPVAGVGIYCMAGADIPVDDRRITAQLAARGWTAETIVHNDTFAVLRAGTERGWGVAVVCGTGMNCAGIGPDGRSVRFPSFGELSGDRAHGGGWLGRSALGAAIRARDGRGPRTVLERTVPAYFKMSRPTAVMEAVYVGSLGEQRLSELAPLVFQAASAGDGVARKLIDEIAEEVVVTVNAAIRRLHVTDRDVHVVLGGGLFRSRDRRLRARIEAGVAAVAPRAVIRRLLAPPVLGAGLIGLDHVRAGPAAHARLRAALTQKSLAG